MFQNERYLSRGADERIPWPISMLLWKMVDSMEISQKDCVQVFELHKTEYGQSILHFQEEPPYRHELDVSPYTKAVDAKVYIIDDGKRSTMLLADEYESEA